MLIHLLTPQLRTLIGLMKARRDICALFCNDGNTSLYDKLKDTGRLLSQMTDDNADGTTNFNPNMNIDPLKEGYKSILQTIYSPDNYYQRIKTFLQEYEPPKINTSVGFDYIMAFIRSVYHLGIFGKERINYWKLLLWTSFHTPRMFPLAIQLAIYGHHFRKICEQQFH